MQVGNLLFKQVRGKAVAQCVHRRALVDLRGFGGRMDGAVQLPGIERIDRIEPGEEPSAVGHPALGTGYAPPDTQAFEQHRREHCIAVLAALALLDTQRHALAVDVCELQRHHFAGTQPGAVGDRESRLGLRLPVAAMSRRTSSGLSTTGSVRGTRVGCIRAMSSGSRSVISKKNFSPVIEALSDTGDVP